MSQSRDQYNVGKYGKFTVDIIIRDDACLIANMTTAAAVH